MNHLRTAAVIFMLFTSGAPVAADDGSATRSWRTLWMIGERSRQARLLDINTDGRMTFETDNGVVTLTSDQLVRWGNPSRRADGSCVRFIDGSEVISVEPWSEPNSVTLDNSRCEVVTRHCGRVVLGRDALLGVVFTAQERVDTNFNAKSEGTHHGEHADVVSLENGDQIQGAIQEVNDGRVSIVNSKRTIALDISLVAAIQLAARSNSRANFETPRWLVGMSDGSRFVVRRIDADSSTPGVLKLETVCGATIPVAKDVEIVFIQSVGDAMVYLSDRKPVAATHVPFFDIPWRFHSDRNVIGGTLQAGGKLFSKGIGVHSASRLVYKLDASHKRFVALIAVDDAAGRRGSVIFRVMLAIEGEWVEAYASPVVRRGDDAREVAVDLNGAQGIALVVDYADFGDENDHADWLDARLE